MASNPLMVKSVHSLENRFGDSRNWPEREVEKLHKLANRSGGDRALDTYSTDRVRDMITRGYLTRFVIEQSGRDDKWVRDLVQAMMASPGFEYRATDDDLVQLRYIYTHIRVNKHYREIARCMDRRVDWVRKYMKDLKAVPRA